jgi:hypothetical protein
MVGRFELPPQVRCVGGDTVPRNVGPREEVRIPTGPPDPAHRSGGDAVAKDDPGKLSGSRLLARANEGKVLARGQRVGILAIGEPSVRME